jgi:hypothetical protein
VTPAEAARVMASIAALVVAAHAVVDEYGTAVQALGESVREYDAAVQQLGEEVPA